MNVLSLREQVKKGTQAVRALRRQRLAKGLPFMINVREVEESVCYMEYPNGSIHRVRQAADGSDFETLVILDKVEAKELRSRFNLD